MSSLSIIAASTLDSAWSEHLGPWLHQAGAKAWQSLLPTAIVTPTHAQAVQLRRRIDAQAMPLFNVRFWSVEELWLRMADALQMGTIVSAPADVTLMARAAAEQLAAESPEDASLGTLSQVPAPLLATLRVLESGGWGAAQIEGEAYRAVANKLRSLLDSGGADTLQNRLFEMERKAGGEPIFESLLFVGFDAASFPVWPLLKASAQLSRDTLVITSVNGPRAEDLDLTWLGSWENLGGQVVGDGDGSISPLAPLAEQFDYPEVSAGSLSDAPVEFSFSRDDAAQAAAIARVVVEKLNAGITPIAVVVPEAGPLAREISLLLSVHAIAHYSSVVPMVTSPEQRAWSALFSVIAAPDALTLANLCSVHSLPEVVSGAHSETVRAALLRACDDLLLPCLSAVGTILATSPRDQDRAACKVVTEWPSFPVNAPISVFVRMVGDHAEKLGMGSLNRRLTSLARRLDRLADIRVSRDAFCEWARAVTSEPNSAAPAESAHPLARVQIIKLREAILTRWGHVILAGQNEGISPSPVRQNGLFSEESIERLNAQVRTLNRRSTEQGLAGVGQLVVRPGKSLCLSPLSRRSLEMRDYLRLFGATDSLTLACSERDPLQPGSPLQPGPILSRVYQLVRGQALTLDHAGKQVLAPVLRMPLPEVTEDLSAVSRAFLCRRDPTTPSGIYDFCLGGPSDRKVRLSASEWGRVARTPAIQWLRSYVGVSLQRRTESSPWGRALGIWVHAWVQDAGGRGFVPNPGAQWVPKTVAAAKAFREKVEAANGGSVPTWWSCLWGQSLAKARLLAQSLTAIQHPWAAVEYPLPFTEVSLAGRQVLPIGGRTDLIFSDRMPVGRDDFSDANLLVVDLKTGSDKPLSIARMEQGIGVQLGLYGLRTRAAGAAHTGLCILRPGDPAEEQVNGDEAASLTALWSTLATMLEHGAFGQLEAVRDEYSHTPELPLATLAVDQRILLSRRENLVRLSFA